MKTVNLIPRVSEKSYALSQQNSVYVFKVPQDANKMTIKDAVAKQFDVTVENVRIAHLPSKVKRSIQKNGKKVYPGKKSAIKKAYVTIKKGESIPIFSAEDDEKDKADKAIKGKKK